MEAKIDIQIPMEARDSALEELMTNLLNQMDPMMRYQDENQGKFTFTNLCKGVFHPLIVLNFRDFKGIAFVYRARESKTLR